MHRQPGCSLANLRSKHPGGTNHPGGMCRNREGRSLTLNSVCQNNRLLKPTGYSNRGGCQAFSWTIHEHKRKYNLRKEAIANRQAHTNRLDHIKGVQCNDQGQCPYSGENPTPPFQGRVRMVNHLILV